MKILFIYGRFGYGSYEGRDGGADFLANLAFQLVSDGDEVHVLSGDDFDENAGGVEIHWLGGNPFSFGWWDRRWEAFDDVLDKVNPDWVFLVHPDGFVRKSTSALYWKLAIGRRPLSIIAFNYGFSGRTFISILSTIFSMISADRLFLTDHDMYVDLARIPVLGNKVKYLPVGSNLDPVGRDSELDVEGSRGEEDAVDSTFSVKSFGFVGFEKGTDLLVEAIGRVFLKYADIRLTLVCGLKGDEFEKNLQARTEALGISERVHWTGHVDAHRAKHELLTADVVVQLFRRNVTGRSSLAAALCSGRPTLTSIPKYPVPFFCDRENVLLSENEVEALEAKLLELIADRSLRLRLQEGAHCLGGQVFSWKLIANRLKRALI